MQTALATQTEGNSGGHFKEGDLGVDPLREVGLPGSLIILTTPVLVLRVSNVEDGDILPKNAPSSRNNDILLNQTA